MQAGVAPERLTYEAKRFWMKVVLPMPAAQAMQAVEHSYVKCVPSSQSMTGM